MLVVVSPPDESQETAAIAITTARSRSSRFSLGILDTWERVTLLVVKQPRSNSVNTRSRQSRRMTP
ncbi:MAG: hypothetical protein DRJ28_10665 [Actinobacteria bacterium]|nr:MAG: hypothetical protein DRJ28_10665 [Actinomycetota bacterium]